ncbi:MAG: purine nucleoside permease [Proteobacteria bacterium]|nr:purine nucleoside permease [Pseudomonadota bacterium]
MGASVLLALAATLASMFAGVAPAAAAPLPVRVVVVTTFEIGEDTGDTPGEFQFWVERLPLPQTLPFALGPRALRYDPRRGILGVVTGGGAINAAAAITALGLDPRFDFRRSYWVLAGIAGINPNEGSIGSAAWAEWVIDRDLSHEIDAREIPADWPTGVVPIGRTRPFETPLPPPGLFSPNAYHLNPALVDWAFRLTEQVALADDPALAALRAHYRQPAAQRPPRVQKGDVIGASDWWLGERMTTLAEEWTRYWTGGRGHATTTAMEDCGVVRALELLARAGRADFARVLVLRSAANYSAPPPGETAAALLAAEASEDGTHLAGFRASLEAAYRTAAPVVNALADGWAQTRRAPPGTPR